MKKYHVSLAGENRYTPGAFLSHGLTFRYDLSEQKHDTFLNSCIAEVQAANPDFTKIHVRLVEEYLESESDDEENNTRIIFQDNAWIDESEF